MIIIKLSEVRIDEALSETDGILKAGGIIAYPTETFYGLGVKFDLGDSLQRLYELKKRPVEKAMPVLIGNRNMLPEIVSRDWLAALPPAARSLMDRFWPGPLTLLCPAREGLSEFLTAGSGTIAVRIPGESFALRLTKKTGFPFTATSANPSGIPPAVNAGEAMHYFEEGLDLLIDGGQTPGGLPSTIVDVSGESTTIIREGAVPGTEIEKHLLHVPARQRMGTRKKA